MEIKLWEQRVKKNITLVELEKMTGISKSTLNNIENGKVSPKVNQLEMIAVALQVKFVDLLNTKYTEIF